MSTRRRPPATAPSPGLRRVLAGAYTTGATSYEIAATVGVDPATVRRWLRQDGVELRAPVPPGRTDVTTTRIVALRARGLSWREIATEVGMSKTGVASRHQVATEGRRRGR